MHFLLVILFSFYCIADSFSQEIEGWNLEWADEFNQANGTLPDSTYWNYDIGTGQWGWGNNESQYYTSRSENARIVNGQLLIEMHKENYNGSQYTSARLKTQNKIDFEYGRIEARLKVPSGGSGLWPAFWALGNDFNTVGWPQCGEIDIMEYISREPYEIFGTVHGPGYEGGASIGNTYTFNQLVANDYHTFAVEWDENIIKWYVDGIHYHTVTPNSLGSREWVFDHPHFLILNLAIGGNFGGWIDPNISFPQQFWIDYVRVYSRDGSSPGNGNANVLLNTGFEDNTLFPWVGVSSGGANTQGGYIEDTSFQYYNGGSPGGANVLARSGTHVAKIFGSFTGQPNVNSFYQDVTVDDGTSWEAGVWALTHPDDLMTGNSVRAYIMFLDNNDTILSLYGSEILDDSNILPGQWVYLNPNQKLDYDYSVIETVSELEAPTGTEKIRFQVMYSQPAYGIGSIYFDDFNLTQSIGPFSLTTTRIGSLNYIYFPTITGYQYKIYETADLNNPSWTLTETINGNGSTNQVYYPAVSTQRFYKIIRDE